MGLSFQSSAPFSDAYTVPSGRKTSKSTTELQEPPTSVQPTKKTKATMGFSRSAASVYFSCGVSGFSQSATKVSGSSLSRSMTPNDPLDFRHGESGIESPFSFH